VRLLLDFIASCEQEQPDPRAPAVLLSLGAALACTAFAGKP